MATRMATVDPRDWSICVRLVHVSGEGGPERQSQAQGQGHGRDLTRLRTNGWSSRAMPRATFHRMS
jgi:hypothetical protein